MSTLPAKRTLPATRTLVITRGLPGSGKSTWARQWVAEDATRRARVNRDDLRQMLFGQPVLDDAGEAAVTAAQRSSVEALLRTGRDVVVDDTNLRAAYARVWVDLAAAVGADLQVRDFTDVPLEVCLERDAARVGPARVGEETIRDLHARFLSGRRLPPLTSGTGPGKAAPQGVAGPASAPYTPDPVLPSAWLVDVDGTLALMNGRGPFEWHRVGEDAPNHAVIDLVHGLRTAGHAIVVVSGRDGSARAATAAWLDRHAIGYDELLLRAAGDNRKDAVVKREIFDTAIRHRWAVHGVLDDRDQVVAMWRALGLTCAQVAPGDF